MNEDVQNLAQQSAETLQNRVDDLRSKAKLAGSAMWDVTKTTYHELQQKTSNCTRATDRLIREKPYMALAIALGLGLLIGAMASRNRTKVVIEEED